MIKKIALGFSIIFHPLLIPTISITILLNSGSFFSDISYETKRLLILLFCSGTCLFPALLIPFMYIRGIISDFQLNERKQRIYPLIITFIFYLLNLILFLRIPVHRFIHILLLGAVMEVLIALIISFRWKISLHMIGLGGLVSFILILSIVQHVNLMGYLILAVIVSGLAGASRLILEAHSLREIFTGFLVGGFIMSACLMIFMH